jgi:hypothetical protein
MEQWLSNVVLPVVIAAAVMLLVLWPTQSSGRRLLRTWGIPEPDPDQVSAAVRYLWQRRILYVVLFLALPSLLNLVWRQDDGVPGLTILVPLVVAMLIAELVAAVRPAGGVRVASLRPRGWRDLVPRWAVWAMGVLVAVVVVGAIVFPASPRDRWQALGSVAVCLVVVGLLVQLAVRRPVGDDEAVATALRLRTARVAVGIGFGWLGGSYVVLARELPYAWGVVVPLAAVAAWIWVANPTRRSLAVRA